MNIIKWLNTISSPQRFYFFCGKWIPWLSFFFVLFLIPGLYGGLVMAPADYQQGDAFRIIYIHVPAAWMSMFIYIVMALQATIAITWRIKISEMLIISSASIGASFTFIALVTGSLWGKPMWGTWWTWDARLTSELILLFIYLGIIMLYNAFDDKRAASKAIAILTLVGVINIPIIHYSVVWWNTLHQGATISTFDKPSIATEMLIPLLLMAVAFKVYYFLALFQRVRVEILDREFNSQWVITLAKEKEHD